MSLLVDTSVRPLAFGRDAPSQCVEVDAVRGALEQGESIICTGLILQELLQGLAGTKSRDRLLLHFSAPPFFRPDRADHLEAAELHDHCRRRGVQAATLDALIAQSCIRHDRILLGTDAGFGRAVRSCPLHNRGAG